MAEIRKYGRARLVSLIMLIAFILIGCSLSPESQIANQEYRRQGKKNALEYIQEKYGFSPEVLEVKEQYDEPGIVPEFFPDSNGMVKVDMEYEGKEFWVRIPGDSESDDGIDTYEKDEILAAMEQHLKELYPEIVDVKFPSMDNDYAGFDTKYDGGNLGEFFTDEQIVLGFTGVDLQEQDYSLVLDEIDCESLCMIDYKSTDHMPFDHHYCFSGTGYPLDSIMPYINQYLYVEPNMDEPYFQQIYSYEFEGITYCTTEDEAINVSRLSDSEIKTVLHKSYSSDLVRTYNIKMVTAYHVQSNAETVVVCVPLSYKKDGTYMEIQPLGEAFSDEEHRIKDSEYLCCPLSKSSDDFATDNMYGVFLLEKDSDYFIDRHLEEIGE
ncbi:MAG: hypothetical protein K6E79_03125 [Pseudobutyrivibrio sp.]|nr:hypothetical protein [Pseudobutyrivibrio sp.]